MYRKYSDDIFEDFTYAKNEAIRLKQAKDNLIAFLRSNNFLNNTDSKDYTIYCHKAGNLIVKITKELIEKNGFVTLHAFNDGWYRDFNLEDLENIKDGITKIISLQA